MKMKRAAGVFWKNRPKLIALTFDDGPSRYTETLLDGLKARGVSVTFFMNGENGTGGVCGIKNGHEALLDRMWEEGHQLANHTYRHAALDQLSPDQIVSEAIGVEKLIFDAVGGKYKCFVRAPYGHVNETIKTNVNAPIILWSVSTSDWKYRDADYVYQKLLSCARRGYIVLLHDIYESSVAGALRGIDALKERGYEFVTVSELMRRTGVRLTNGTVYCKGKNNIVFRPAYEAPAVTVTEDSSSELFEVTCRMSADIPIYFTMDGTYPRLSDQIYSGTVLVKPGTEFMAVGIDEWGTRTPLAAVTIGAN